MDMKDTPAGLMSAVRDIMTKNQNLFQQDLESRYSQYNEPPASTENNETPEQTTNTDTPE